MDQIAASDEELGRCLAFTDAMSEVKMWPILICSMECVNEAVKAEYLYKIREDSLIPRWGMTTIVYGISTKGRVKYQELLMKLNKEILNDRSSNNNGHGKAGQ